MSYLTEKLHKAELERERAFNAMNSVEKGSKAYETAKSLYELANDLYWAAHEAAYRESIENRIVPINPNDMHPHWR